MATKFKGFLQKVRKAAVPLTICSVIIFTCTWVLWHHYRTANIAELVGTDAIKKMETKLLDMRFLMRGKIAPTGQVGILALDEKSIQRFGRWPFPRGIYEQAFDNLKKLGVRWISFDATWSEPERALLQDAKTQLEQVRSGALKKDAPVVEGAMGEIGEMFEASPGDRSLARGVGNFKNIVLGYFFYGTKLDAEDLGEQKFKGLDLMLNSAIAGVILPDKFDLSGKSYPRIQTHGIVANIPIIAKATPHFAFFNNEGDWDAIMRWVHLVRVIDGNLMPSLSLKTAAEALGRQILVQFDEIGVKEVSLVGEDNSEIKIPVDPDGYGRILINHRGPDRTIPHFSLADAYDNKFTAAEQKALKNKVLLLGPTAVGINDQRPNPYDPAINGVETHAAVVDNIIRGDFLKRPGSIYMTEIAIVLGVGLLFSPLVLFGRAIFSGIALVGFLVAFYYFDKYYWFGRGTWAYMGIPVFEILGLYVSVTLYKYMTEEREKKKVKGAFQHYLSPDVIKQVLDNPDRLKLGGERKELTVFFSDVRNFTNISETLTAEKLSELMNDYLSPMTSIVLRSQGTLDKYVGDMIMAFWGAPLPMDNHADTGVLAAVTMLMELEKVHVTLKKKNLPVVNFGSGLNTGPMSVGNMGSQERFAYTVMGDAVNLGSRLESLTKSYGIACMISEFTQARLTRKDIFRRNLDDIRVKGKNEPVNVFEVLKPNIVGTEERLRNLIGEFEEGRKKYRAMDWPGSRQHFESCLAIRPDDGPSKLFLERLAEYEKEPPVAAGEVWDGVYTFKHK